MPVHLPTSDQIVISGSEKIGTDPLVERLSNNVDNFRSILDCMMDLIKHQCKDEAAEAEVSVDCIKVDGNINFSLFNRFIFLTDSGSL
jgi:hypothetical protein